ncbi:hypothetical protein [Parvularcula maris]|uniref:Uncharacterized protein n=1 Tax=Parvularcula maris TaxID=2965077 RepID=A0A9X2L6N3_9PROT|nr:hypothetical protein [Parvularcula maris]MCQ8184032.1 hypothetical protein [Parvularcula maris]
MMNRLLMAMAALLSMAGAAKAQNELMPSPTMKLMSRADYFSILTEMQITPQVFSPDGTATLIRGELPSGNAFVIEPRGCADPVAIEGCRLTSLAVGFEPFNVSYPRLNEFHSTKAKLATAIRVGNNQGIVLAKLLTQEGVSRDTVKLYIALFLQDVGDFYEGWVANAGLSQSVGVQSDFGPLFAGPQSGYLQSITYGRLIDLTAPRIGQEDMSFLTSAAKAMVEAEQGKR